MPANFRSSNNDAWKVNTSNLVLNSSKIKINKKQKERNEELEQEIFQEELDLSIASILAEPSDDIDLPMISRSIYVGKKGSLSFLTEDDQIKTISVKSDSSFFDIKTRRILFTNTSASSIIVLF